MGPKKRPADGDDENIITNLNKKLGKAAVDKAIKQLAKDGAIKSNKSNNVYCLVQDDPEDITLQVLAADRASKQLEQKKKDLSERNKQLKSELKKFQNVPSMDKINSDTVLLDNEINMARKKYNAIKSSMGDSDLSSEFAAELDVSKKQHKKLKALYKERKESFSTIFDLVTDNLPDKPKDFKEEKGIIDDQEAGFDIKRY